MYSFKHIVGGMAAALLVLACAFPALASTRITSVEPKTVQQGDTVLLTIKGDQLPSGNIRLEFFPQQIAVLSTDLSKNNTELTAQVKIPQLATPGAYNVMVSNQLGDEAFGQALLTVVGTVRTPVFKSYDPKVIAKADNGFALILTGEQLAPEVAPQLSAVWQQDDSTLGGLTTSFTYAPGQVICAVTGRLPNGIIRGKISMAGKPIYQVEIEVRGGTAIIGHTPASIHSADGPMVLKLVGDDLSAGWLSKAKVSLRAGKKEVAASHVALRDGASGEVEFTGPLPVGDWTLVVAMDNVAIYQGALTVLPALPAPKVPVAPAEPAQDLRNLMETLDSKPAANPLPESEVITSVEEATTDNVNDAALILDSLTPPDGFQMTEVDVAPSTPTAAQTSSSKATAVVPQAGPAIRIDSATFSPATAGPSRLVLSGANLTPDLVDRLKVEISYRGGTLQPDLSMSTPAGLTYMFPARRDLPEATVVVRDPQNKVPTFRQRLGGPDEAVPTIREQVANSTTPATPLEQRHADPKPVAPVKQGNGLSAELDGPVLVDAGGFTVSLSNVPDGLDWSTAKLSSTHPILSPNAGKFGIEAPLSGSKTLLHLTRDSSALPDMIYNVLTDMLCESASVPLHFDFADGKSIDLDAKFEKKEAATSQDDGPTSGILH